MEKVLGRSLRSSKEIRSTVNPEEKLSPPRTRTGGTQRVEGPWGWEAAISDVLHVGELEGTRGAKQVTSSFADTFEPWVLPRISTQQCGPLFLRA